MITKKYKPDVIGFQEVLHSQLKDLRHQLTKYDWVGVGRRNGKTKGEYAPSFLS